MANDTLDFESDEREASTTAKRPEGFDYVPAKRHGIKAIVLLYGKSGSGKTKSALRLARGLVGPKGNIYMLDTEHNRGKYYADEERYHHAVMEAPYTPERYVQALRKAVASGADCLIIDSMSHVQEGEGGLIDMAEKQAEVIKSDGYQKWAKPKAAWKKARNAFLSAPIHVIFCARAKNPLEKVEGGRNKMEAGALTPIMPADFEYEVVVSLGIEVGTHAIVPTKLPNQLMGAFPLDEFITESSGEQMRQWLDGEKIVDHAFDRLKEEGRAAARQGPLALKGWWSELGGNNQRRLKDFLDTELKALAAKASPPSQAQATSAAAGDAAPNPPARAPASPAEPPPPKQTAAAAADFPDIPLDVQGFAPSDWMQVAMDICDVIDRHADRIDAVMGTYADHLKAMPTRPLNLVKDSEKKARGQ